jgi:hypothetical protein
MRDSMNELAKEKVTIQINSDLYKELQQKLVGTSFASVDDLVNYVLRIAITKKAEADLSPEDSASVTARLKKLGYI